MKRTVIALATALVLSLAGGALATPRSTAGFSHLHDLNALNNQRQSWLHAYPTHLLELKALARSAAAWAKKYPPRSTTYPTHLSELQALNNERLASEAVPPKSGFRWGDAGVGAGTGFGLALLMAGGLVAVLRRSPRFGLR
jgi:hypothetical protein